MTDETEQSAAPKVAAEKLQSVTARKAFLTATGWVQSGDEIHVTEDRKRELGRNGLLEGVVSEDEGSVTSEPLGSGRPRTRKLNVGASVGGTPPKEGEA